MVYSKNIQKALRSCFCVCLCETLRGKVGKWEVGLPHVLDLTVHLVNFFGQMSQGGHAEPLLLLTLFYQSTLSCLKVRGWNEQSGMLV